MRSYLLLTAALAGAFALGTTSCQLLDASQAADSGFNPSTAPTRTRAEFVQQAWVDKAYRGKSVKDHFSSVYVAPIRTKHMAAQSWWQQQTGTRKAELASDTQSLANRMRKQFQQSIANYPGDNRDKACWWSNSRSSSSSPQMPTGMPVPLPRAS